MVATKNSKARIAGVIGNLPWKANLPFLLSWCTEFLDLHDFFVPHIPHAVHSPNLPKL
jgi:hypothetical protein